MRNIKNALLVDCFRAQSPALSEKNNAGVTGKSGGIEVSLKLSTLKANPTEFLDHNSQKIIN